MHVLRDGRDVVCSLLERGWFRAARDGADDAGHAYGAHARFWVEPDRRDEFASACETRRAAWAWRRYVGAARLPARRSSFRYESLSTIARRGCCRRGARLRTRRRFGALSAASRPIDRPLAERIEPEQLADVEAEAGDLLRELGYTLSE